MGLAGNGFSLKPEGRYLLVGGGIGIPPMLGCAEYTRKNATALLAGRSRQKIILLDRFEDTCEKVFVATDDGSLGHCGFVDYLVHGVLNADKKYDGVLACGPKPMLKNVAKIAEQFHIPCQVSLEERMGCGVGACLVCACDMADGSRKHVCKDGPVFDSKEVNWDGKP
jgi:dihydroorotate dehydrogenase electron transfer subunit